MKTKNKSLTEKDICCAGMYQNKTRVILPEDVYSALAGLKGEIKSAREAKTTNSEYVRGIDTGLDMCYHCIAKWFPFAKEKEKPKHGGGCGG